MCTGFESGWNSMESTPSLPVVQGVEVTLSCTEGYGLKGDEKITCQKDNEFTYQTSLQCGERILSKYTKSV